MKDTFSSRDLVPEFKECNFVVSLRNAKHFERLGDIVKPDRELEQVYFGDQEWPALSTDLIRQELAWFKPKLHLFSKDKFLKAWLDKSLKDLCKSFTRKQLRRGLYASFSFEFAVLRQSAMLRLAGASDALIRWVVIFQCQARAELLERSRLYYPTWGQMKKAMDELKGLVSCADAFIEKDKCVAKNLPHPVWAAEIDTGVPYNIVALAIMVGAALDGDRHSGPLAVLMAHYILTEMKPKPELLAYPDEELAAALDKARADRASRLAMTAERRAGAAEAAP